MKAVINIGRINTNRDEDVLGFLSLNLSLGRRMFLLDVGMHSHTSWGMIWYDTIWYYVIWWYMIWYDTIWYDLRWYDMIWHDMIWYDMIWYDMIWYDMIWYDMIWYDVTWYDMIYIVNCNSVDTRWQQYSTHIHTNNTQNNTMNQNIQNGTYITIRIHNLQN